MTKGQHKIIMTVEIDGGDLVVSQTQEFSGGNPLFHASEFFRNSVHPIRKIKKALTAIYGEKPAEEWKPTLNADTNLGESIEAAQEKGGRVFRYVMLVNGLTFTGEAMFRSKFVGEWGNMIDRPELHKAEYGIPVSGEKFSYTWHTL